VDLLGRLIMEALRGLLTLALKSSALVLQNSLLRSSLGDMDLDNVGDLDLSFRRPNFMTLAPAGDLDLSLGWPDFTPTDNAGAGDGDLLLGSYDFTPSGCAGDNDLACAAFSASSPFAQILGTGGIRGGPRGPT